jgi:Low affinity iron permease
VVLKGLRRTSLRTIAGVELRSPSSELFDRAAVRVAGVASWRWAVIGSVILLLVWAMTGPILQFSDEIQLFVNTTTTVVTFGTVLAIQNKRPRGSTGAAAPTPAPAPRDDPHNRPGAH